MMSTLNPNNHAIDEPELVELHFELEIDSQHAFQEDQVITRCVAEVMGLKASDVSFDGVEEFQQNNAYFGCVRGHIPTTKYNIEDLVQRFYDSLQNGQLKDKITSYSGIKGAPYLHMRELYETDRNISQQIEDANLYEMRQTEQQQIKQQQYQQQQQMSHNHKSQKSNNMDSILNDLKQLLNVGFQTIDSEFEQLLNDCKKQMIEDI